MESPDLEQIMRERRKALQAVTELGTISTGEDIERAPHIFTSEGEDDSDDARSKADQVTLIQDTQETAGL